MACLAKAKTIDENPVRNARLKKVLLLVVEVLSCVGRGQGDEWAGLQEARSSFHPLPILCCFVGCP